MSKALVLMKSGHCNTAHLNRATPNGPAEAHLRCRMDRCPCACHFEHPEIVKYECECGGTLVETAIPNPDPTDVDEDGNLYPVYLHLAHDGEATGQECP